MINQKYQVKDIAIASYFYSQGIKLLGLQKSNTGTFYYFIFSNYDQCQKLEQKYWAKEAFIDVMTFMDSFRALKQQLFRQS